MSPLKKNKLKSKLNDVFKIIIHKNYKIDYDSSKIIRIL